MELRELKRASKFETAVLINLKHFLKKKSGLAIRAKILSENIAQELQKALQ